MMHWCKVWYSDGSDGACVVLEKMKLMYGVKMHFCGEIVMFGNTRSVWWYDLTAYGDARNDRTS